MWLIIRIRYLKSLRNKEVTVKIFLRKILSSRENKSEHIGARVINLVTSDVVYDKEHIFKV
jgi:hypothetical protein